MNKSLTFAAFAMGAIIGSLATWQIIKKKYERIAQEEIDSVKETFSKTFKTIEEVETDNTDVEKTHESFVNKYTGNSDEEEKTEESPYRLITPEEFGEHTDYKIISLSFFADKKLADDSGYIVDIEETVGFESLEHFGDFVDDAVYVRNDKLKTDYEVLLEERKYAEVYKNRI